MISAFDAARDLEAIEGHRSGNPFDSEDIVVVTVSYRFEDEFREMIDPSDPYRLTTRGLKAAVHVPLDELEAVATTLRLLARQATSVWERRAASSDAARIPSRTATGDTVAA